MLVKQKLKVIVVVIVVVVVVVSAAVYALYVLKCFQSITENYDSCYLL